MMQILKIFQGFIDKVQNKGSDKAILDKCLKYTLSHIKDNGVQIGDHWMITEKALAGADAGSELRFGFFENITSSQNFTLDETDFEGYIMSPSIKKEL